MRSDDAVRSLSVEKMDTGSRRIEKFIDVLQGLWSVIDLSSMYRLPVGPTRMISND